MGFPGAPALKMSLQQHGVPSAHAPQSTEASRPCTNCILENKQHLGFGSEDERHFHVLMQA